MNAKNDLFSYPAKSVPDFTWRVIYFRQVAVRQAVDRMNAHLAATWRQLGGYFQKKAAKRGTPPLEATAGAAWRLAGICPSKEGKERPRFRRAAPLFSGVGGCDSFAAKLVKKQN